MVLPAYPKSFAQGEDPSRWHGSFQYVHFIRIDTRKYDTVPSFYRSDFRGARLEQCHFSSTNIDRSDFVGSIIDCCTFDKVYFGNSGICNTTVTSSMFVRVRLNAGEISRSYFQNCTFEGCDFFNTTAFDVRFERCSFTDCSFKGAGFENITFEQCRFVNADLADMTPYNFMFKGCDLSGVKFSLDYIGSYLFDATSISKVMYKYLDTELDISELDEVTSRALLENFETNRRYPELFNLYIYISPSLRHMPNLARAAIRALNGALRHPHVIESNESLKNIFRAIDFHFSVGQFRIPELLKVLQWIRSKAVVIADFEKSYLLDERANYFEKLLTFGRYPAEYLSDTELYKTPAIVEFVFEGLDREIGIDEVRKIFGVIDTVGGGLGVEYTILEVRAGSVIVQVLTAAVFALIIVKAARATIGCLIQTAVMIAVGTAIMKQLNKATTPEDVKRCLSVIGVDFLKITSLETVADALRTVSKIGVKLGQTQEGSGN
ncbi:MAG: pentapeptide repeat-containing protein [Alphaproteobacteria bacterium]